MQGLNFMVLRFHNPRPQVHRQNLRCWLYAQQLKQAQENYQTYTAWASHLIFNDWVIVNVLP